MHGQIAMEIIRLGGIEAWRRCRYCRTLCQLKREFVSWYVNQTKIDVGSDEFIAVFKKIESWNLLPTK